MFDIKDNKKIYCTELIYLVLKDINFTENLTTEYIEKRELEVIPLEAISNSRFFHEVLFIGDIEYHE